MSAGQGVFAQPIADKEPTLSITIIRQPLQLRAPATYDIPLKLEAARNVTLVAAEDGVVTSVMVTAGDNKILSGTELVRLDAKLAQLEKERAELALKVADVEAIEASGPVNTARVVLAKKDVEIAEAKLDRTIVRAPFDGQVFEIPVVEGSFVRAGDPLVTVTDQQKLIAVIPIDRKNFKAGDSVELKVEEATIQAKLTGIIPLKAKFDPLRGLFESVATGVVEIENPDGRFLTGQTVYSPMIPRTNVTEVPNSAVRTGDGGGRMVQVIREGFAREIPVEMHGQVGIDHIWVSGRFVSGDELVLESSEPLLNGARVAPANAPVPVDGAQGGGAGGKPTVPRAPVTDF